MIAGLKADEVHLSLEPDMTKLTDEGLVAEDWKDGENKGIVTQSVVAIVVRKGNPKSIKGWDDLIKPGIKIVTPNPGSSGSAKWNILAAYGHILAGGGSDAEAQAYLAKLLGNVAAFPGSAKDATTAFEGGTGDVLLSYENEAIQARAAGADFDYIIPDQTLLIENPGAVTKDASDAAQDFLDYQIGTDGQTDYAKQGFRPLDDSIEVEVEGANDPADAFPTPETLLTIDDDFGGLGRGQHEVLRRGERHRHQADRRLRQVLMASVGIATAPGAARRRRTRSRRSLTAGSGVALGVTMIWFSLLVLIPLTAVLVSAADLGLSGFWDVVTQPQTAAALRLTVAGVARGHRAQHRDGYGAGLGAGPRPVLGQAPGRRRDRRAVRPADDRRRPGAALPLRAVVAAGRQRRQHADRGVPRARVRDAAVRRAHRPAGAGVPRA